jgi:hypothetical protein
VEPPPFLPVSPFCFFAFSPPLFLVLILATFTAADGLLSIGEGLDSARSIDRPASAAILRGAVGLAVAFGFITLAMIGRPSMVVVAFLIIFWSFIAAALDLAMAVKFSRRKAEVEWLLAGAGLLTIAVGVGISLMASSLLEAAQPAVTLLIGTYGLCGGALLVGHGFGFGRREQDR